MAKLLVKDMAKILNVTTQAVHQRLKRSGFQPPRESNATQIPPEIARNLIGIDYESKIVSVNALKGGCGKTSISHNLAVCASQMGISVLCVDLDQQGNLTSAFDKLKDADNFNTIFDTLVDKTISIKNSIINVGPCLDLMPSDIRNSQIDPILEKKSYPLNEVFKSRLRPLLRDNGGTYDLIIIDNAPALTRAVAASILSSDITLSPLNCGKFDMVGISVMMDHIREYIEDIFNVKINIKILLNKTDSRTLLSKFIRDSLLKNDSFSDNLLHTQIRLCQEFPNSQAKTESVFDNTKDTTAKEDILSLLKEIFDIDNKIHARAHLKRDLVPEREISL